MRTKIVGLLFLVILATVGSVHASSLSASFNLINSTVSINNNIYFNLSGDFPSQTNYTIFLNQTPIHSGSIPSNSSKYYIIKYNISNMQYGEYNSKIEFYPYNIKLNSSINLYIMPKSSFVFVNPQPTTEITKNYSLIDIKLKNVGNTPLYMNWSLPAFRNISISLNFQQRFELNDGQNKSILINLSLQKGYQPNISFGFTGKYLNYSKTKYYSTLLIKPHVNMSFYNENTTSINSTRELFIFNVKNYNNIPVRLLLKFTLDVNGSTLYYTKSYTLPVNATKIEVYLPKSTVENVQVSYENSNLSTVTESIFTAPKKPLKISIGYIIDTLGYIIFTVGAILILVLIHIRLRKKEQKQKNGKNK